MAVAARPGRWREPRLELQIINNTNIASHANNASHVSHPRIGGAYRGKAKGGEKTRAMVLNVTVAVAAFFPSSVTDDGETVHVAWGGAPVQLHITVGVEPCSGVAEAVKFACCPAVIVALGGAAETLKSGGQLAADTDARVEQRSSRPLPMPGSASGTACATAAAPLDWLMAALRLCSNAAPPETNGALNEVPHPAA